MTAVLSQFQDLRFIPSAPTPSCASRMRMPGAVGHYLTETIVNAAMNAILKSGIGAMTFAPSAVYGLPVTFAAARFRLAHPASVMTSGDMAEMIVGKLDFPITALSEVLDVERKTIYDWLKIGSEAQSANAERLRVLIEAFREEQDGSLRFYHRFWKRPLSGGECLHGVLTASGVDVATIRRALAELRPAVLSAVASSNTRNAVSLVHPRDSGVLSDFLEVGTRY